MSARGRVLRVAMPLHFEAGDHRGRRVTADASRAEPTAPLSETTGAFPLRHLGNC